MKRQIKQIAIWILFTIEITLFSSVLLYGKNGLYAILELYKENKQIIQETQKIDRQIQLLENKILEWNAHDFYKEKVAREQLQMARPHDRVYYLAQ